MIVSRIVCAAVLSGLTLAAAPVPRFFVPEPIPVARVKANLEAKIAEDGGDWDAHYQLGRLHTMVAATGMETVVARLDARATNVYPLDWQVVQRVKTRELTDLERVEHFDAAIRHMRTAYVLQRHDPRVVLSYAYLLEQAEPLRTQLSEVPLRRNVEIKDTPASQSQDAVIHEVLNNSHKRETNIDLMVALWAGDDDLLGRQLHNLKRRIEQDTVEVRRQVADDVLRQLWRLQVIDLYYEACTSASRNELRPGIGMYGLEGLVTTEAADAFTRLVDEWDITDKFRLAAVQELRKQAIAAPRMVTPIILSLDAPAPLESLTAPDTTVAFDFDGTGREQRWSWVSPDTAILVWDPDETGAITSGRQLFGSVTWWLFWDTGYHALAALDDDANGWIEGPVLAGLAVWHDRDSNGVSDPGEVTPIRNTPIEAIACTQTDTIADDTPANLTGLRLDDGTVLPTYDWIAEEQHAGPHAQQRPKPAGMLGARVERIADVAALDSFRINIVRPHELVLGEPMQPDIRITDRGLIVDSHLYCIRIVVPDSTHSMPVAVGEGVTVPMPTWPGDLLEGDE